MVYKKERGKEIKVLKRKQLLENNIYWPKMTKF